MKKVFFLVLIVLSSKVWSLPNLVGTWDFVQIFGIIGFPLSEKKITTPEYKTSITFLPNNKYYWSDLSDMLFDYLLDSQAGIIYLTRVNNDVQKHPIIKYREINPNYLIIVFDVFPEINSINMDIALLIKRQ